MSGTINWHGTSEESLALIAAIAHNCACEFGLMGIRLNAGGPHQMLSRDQRALDGLLFARHMARRLRAEEFSSGSRTVVES